MRRKKLEKRGGGSGETEVQKREKRREGKKKGVIGKKIGLC